MWEELKDNPQMVNPPGRTGKSRAGQPLPGPARRSLCRPLVPLGSSGLLLNFLGHRVAAPVTS